jgi:ABC-type amino acid transport substrate-binding protein
MRPGWRILVLGVALMFPWLIGAASAESQILKVAVLDDAPPLGYRDAAGKLTGFSVGIMQALCEEINVRCEFQATPFEHLLEDLAAGHFDVAAVGLLNTPERRQKVLFTRPVYRSQTLLFARQGMQPGQPGVRTSTFKGSAQERYIRRQGWDYIGAQTDDDIVEQIAAGVAQVCVVPLMTSLNLRKNRNFLKLGLEPIVFQVPELENNASFALAPQHLELKAALDRALDRIKVNGVYDRVNSKFLPFRVD